MSKKISRLTANKALKCLIAFLFAFTTLTAPLITPNLSYAKYVIDPIEYTISVESKTIYNITSIGAISGTAQVGHTLTAGTLTPSEATVVYQWQSSASEGGIYTDIAGATSNTYTLTGSDYNNYVRVSVTGSGSYTGTVNSTAVGPVTSVVITAIGAVSGTTQTGETLTAGTLSPAGATATYQWQKSWYVAGNDWADISGATSSTYVVASNGSLNGAYIRVIATGTGGYTGTVASSYVGPVVTEATPITAIGAISGTAQVGQTLTAGDLSPSGATATFQWQRSNTLEGTYTNIAGATSTTYTLSGSDYNSYIRVKATGSGGYTGTATSTTTVLVMAAPITNIGTISGTAQLGATLTAGELTPSEATAVYQWQRSTTEGGIYENITGATASTYTLTAEDLDNYIKVTATGTGGYTGTVTSLQIGPVVMEAISITAIGSISGTAQVGYTLTAGNLTPSEATAMYQWQRSTTEGGIYTDIAGATSNTYTLIGSDYNSYVRVKATGNGSYTGTVNSAPVGPMSAGVITTIGAITGTTQPGETLTAGSLTPVGATATYQWQKSWYIAGNDWSDISEATSSTYVVAPNGSLNGAYIRVVATGNGSYTGTATSAYVGPVVTEVIPITSIGAISGTAQVGQTLTAGILNPSGATATYQWQRSNIEGGTYTNISGATASTYTLAAGDNNYYIRVTATGSGGYTGTATSASTGPVSPAPVTAIGAISGTVQLGSTLTAGTLTPLGANVAYQWQRSNTEGGTYTNISGATASTYTLTAGDLDNYIKVTATGTGGFTGTATSTPVGPVVTEAISITAIGSISGTAQVGYTLTAGNLTPSEATAVYQWQRSATEGGIYTDIAGATSNTYTLIGSDYNSYVRVKATGSGSYVGTVNSAAVGPMSTGVITAIGVITGTTKPGETLTAGNLTPFGATATYQWQKSWYVAGNDWSDISGATSSTYVVAPNGSLKGAYVRVVATGNGSYTGTATSAYVGPVVTEVIPITSIGAISGTAQVGQTLTAGILNPSGATATYQWKRSNAEGGTYTNISGATASTYTLVPGDKNYYIRVTATGSGGYTGTATSASTGPVSPTSVTAIGEISGTVQLGSTLTAGTLTPLGASVAYQWQRSNTEGGTYTNISGATASTYTLTAGDLDNYIKVIATGTGGYAGTVASTPVGPVVTEAVSITDIGAISGTTQVGYTLTAGTLTPSEATVVYQWQRSNTEGGTYTNISGATSNTYTLIGSDYNKYVRVKVTGSGSYSGTVNSAAVGPMSAGIISEIGNISGDPVTGETLTAGSLSPVGATATYQWQKSWYVAGNAWSNISGANSSTYVVAPNGSLNGAYIRVVATGTDGYTGTVESAYVGPVSAESQMLLIMELVDLTIDQSNITGGGLTVTAGAIEAEAAKAAEAEAAKAAEEEAAKAAEAEAAKAAEAEAAEDPMPDTPDTNTGDGAGAAMDENTPSSTEQTTSEGQN